MTTKRANELKQWPPIHELKYASGKRGFQVACMLDGERIRATFKTRRETETRAAEIRVRVESRGRVEVCSSGSTLHSFLPRAARKQSGSRNWLQSRERVPRFGIIGLDPQRLLELSNRLSNLARLLQGDSQIVVRVDVIWIDP